MPSDVHCSFLQGSITPKSTRQIAMKFSANFHAPHGMNPVSLASASPLAPPSGQNVKVPISKSIGWIAMAPGEHTDAPQRRNPVMTVPPAPAAHQNVKFVTLAQFKFKFPLRQCLLFKLIFTFHQSLQKALKLSY